MKVKEWNPEEYNEYNGIEATPETDKADEPGMLTLLMKAPSAFWSIGLVQFFCWAAFLFMWTYTNGTVAANAFDTPIINGQLDVKSDAYQIAGNWVGILFAVQALGSVAWATIIPRIKNTKMGYMLSLVLGGIGFISMGFITDQYLLFVSFILIGCGWAAMLAYPFALLTNALEGKGHMGTYLGLFNGTICLPQIVAALLGGVILKVLPLAENGASNQPMMMVIAGILLFAGAASVFAIKAK